MSFSKIGALLSAASVVACATASYAAEVRLKAASFLPARAINAKPFYRWVGEVNKQCAGKVQISVVGPAAIQTLEQWNAVRSGVVDMHYGPANYYKGVMPEADVNLLATNTAADQRKNGAWKMFNELHNQKMKSWYLTVIHAGGSFYIWTTKPAPKGSFKGFRLRSVPIYDEFFRSLGASPVRMSPTEVFTALERNTVDGYGWPLWGVADFGWHKHTKFQYGPGFFTVAVNILINLEKWKSLSDEQRQCLNQMALWLEKEQLKWIDAENEKQRAIIKKAGIKYVDLGPGFSKKATDIHWASLEKINPEFIKKIRPLLLK